MWLLILEAGGAMFLLVFIVWWTMFSGQKPTLPPPKHSQKTDLTPDADKTPATKSRDEADKP